MRLKKIALLTASNGYAVLKLQTLRTVIGGGKIAKEEQ